MTEIEYSLTENEFSIKCVGHAGYAKKGNDIVCAAISILTQTLGEHMKNVADEWFYDTGSDKDNAYLFCDAKGSRATECFKMTLTGLKMLQAAYPQHLEIKEGCPFFYKNDL